MNKIISIMKNPDKKKLFIIAVIVICLVCIGGVIFAYWSYQKETEENVVKLEELAEKVTTQATTPEKKEDKTEAKQDEQTEAESQASSQVHVAKHDFEALKQENKDIYAWIQMPDTEVDYPILQSEEDNKYLDTNIDGSKGYPGCIYTNVCNSKAFDDYITLVYGHNMKSGAMFGTLDYFYEKEFFDSFDTYTVETPEACFTYSVYAAVNYDDKLIPAYYDVKSSLGRDEFVKSLEACRGNSKTHFNDEVEISGEDKLLVLSVCISGQDDRRYLIVSKLEDVQNY